MKALAQIFLFSILLGCVEPFTPDVEEYERILVVDGLFSNNDEPSIVVLSESFSYTSEDATYIDGASVIIEDDLGAMTILQETEPGIYQTDPTIFKGKTGRTYRLKLTLKEGNNFESEWEFMKPAPPIQKIYAVFEERIQNDPKLSPVKGAQFYLNTRDEENATQFYKWDWEETYNYGLPYPKFIRVEFSGSPGDGNDRIISINGPDFEGFDCYKTEKSTEILIASTENIGNGMVQDFPLRFVNNRGSQLYSRYSLLAKQYALSKDYYEYLRKLEEVNESSGGLFDPIPNEVFGNVKNVDNINLPVLGYFAVAGVNESRIFVERSEVPNGFGAPKGPVCKTDTTGLDLKALYRKVSLEKLVLYDYNYSPFGGILGFLVAEPRCTSCADNDATNEKPSFW